MADEQDNETPETPANDTPETEVAEAPTDAAEDQTPEAEAPAEEPAAEEPAAEAAVEEPAAEAPAEEPAAEEPAAEAPAEEPAAEEPAADDAAEAEAGDETPAPAAAEPEEQLSAKDRRRRKRSVHTGKPGPQRTAEDRHNDRVAGRKDKAVRRRRRRLGERAKAAERRAAKPAAEPLPPVHAPVEGARRIRQGVVVSDKAAKTITVRIDIARRHRRYEKIVRSSSTVHAHDENNDANEGDVVRVVESRPLSRTKRWSLVDVVERAR
jgi:small subunit ribosomal protein S17